MDHLSSSEKFYVMAVHLMSFSEKLGSKVSFYVYDARSSVVGGSLLHISKSRLNTCRYFAILESIFQEIVF